MTQSSRGRDCEQGRDDDFKYYNFWLLGLLHWDPAWKSQKARNFWVGLKFDFDRSLGLFEVWVSSKFGFVRLHRF